MRYGIIGVVLLCCVFSWSAPGAQTTCNRQQAEKALHDFDEAVSTLPEKIQENFLEKYSQELDRLEDAEAAEDWEAVCRLLSDFKLPTHR